MSERGPGTPRATWVGKLGGSLLEPPDFPDLPAHLEALLEARGGERPVLVNGGGLAVDQLRRWYRLFDLEETFCHWAAVRLLDHNASVLEAVLPRARRVESLEELEEVWAEERWPLLGCESFLREIDARRPDPLPRRWEVTSDSIAARVADHLGAPELALLKSADPPVTRSLEEAARQGFVDSHFPRAAGRLARVVSINLREAPPFRVHSLKS